MGWQDAPVVEDGTPAWAKAPIIGGGNAPAETIPTRDLTMQSRMIPRRTDPASMPAFNARDFPEQVGSGVAEMTGSPAVGALAKGVTALAPFNPASLVRQAPKAVSAIAELAARMRGAAGGAIDTVKGVPVQTAAEALRGQISGELGGAQRTYATEAERLAAQQTDAAAQSQRAIDAASRQSGSPQGAALTDIASAQGAVRGKLQQQATAASQQAQQHLDTLAPKPMAAEDIGAAIQERGAANLEKAQADTVKTAITDIKEPAFNKARLRAMQGDTPGANPASKPILDQAVADIKQQIADTPAEFRAGLEKRVGAITGGNEPITLHQLEFLRRWAKDPALREQTGFGALDSARMAKTSDTIRQAMTAYEPDVARYINAYRTGKEGEAVILGSRGARATDKVLETDAATIFGQKPQQAASAYLDGTRSSANQLLALVGGNKSEVAPMVNAYLRGQIEGKTPAEVIKLISKNNGLLEVFPDAKPIMLKYAQASNEAERLNGLAGKEAGRLRGTSDQAVAAREAARTGQAKTVESMQSEQSKATDAAGKQIAKTSAKASDYANDITILDAISAEKVATSAETTANKMLKDGFISPERHKELTARIAEIERLQGSTKAARGAMRAALYAAGGAAVYGAGRHYLPIP